MSFITKLFVDGKAITLLDISWSVDKQADETGKPIAMATGGQFNVAFELAKKEGDFLDWVQTIDMVKNGSIIYYKDELLAVKHKLEFKYAYCLNFSVDADSEGRAIAHVTISAQEFTFDGITFKNRWGIGGDDDDKKDS